MSCIIFDASPTPTLKIVESTSTPSGKNLATLASTIIPSLGGVQFVPDPWDLGTDPWIRTQKSRLQNRPLFVR
jgi:hypothetical protein